MSLPTTIFLAGGGTGGHLYPGIAVAEALRKKSADINPVFLCTMRDIDRMILEPTGFEFIPQPIVPPVRTVNGLLKFWTSWRETKDLVRRERRTRHPAAVLGLGGYAAGVAVRYLASRKVPAAILNPDVIPGKANQFLMKYAKAVCCQFEETAEYLSATNRKKVKVTGCPIRQDMANPPTREQAAGRLGLDRLLNTLVITGASQGAATVNDAVLAVVSSLKLQGWQILHLTGKEHAVSVRAGYREKSIPAMVIDFTPAMADVWAVANLAISRAGASSVAELAACGVPSILFPYPFHKDLHQRANAKVLADSGGAILLEDLKDAKKNAVNLQPAVESLLYDSPRRHSMSTAARSLGKPRAAEAVADIIMEMVGAGR